MLECIVNRDALATLPDDLKQIVELACATLNDQMAAEFSARNAEYLAELEQDASVEIRPFPAEVIEQLRTLTDELVQELIERDPRSQKIYESFMAYKQKAERWSAISEQAYLNTRQL